MIKQLIFAATVKTHHQIELFWCGAGVYQLVFTCTSSHPRLAGVQDSYVLYDKEDAISWAKRSAACDGGRVSIDHTWHA